MSRIIRALSIGVILAATASAAAKETGGRDEITSGRAGVVPLSQLMPSVRRAVPGRVMSARLRGSTYFIRILTRRGDVIVVRADGRSGRILDVDGR